MNQLWSSFSRRHLEMHDIASRIIIILLSEVIRDRSAFKIHVKGKINGRAI